MDICYQVRSVSCRLKNLRIQDLKLSDGTDEWAMMHGKRCKAAATRHIAPFVASLAREYFDGPHPKHRSIVKVAESLCGIYDVLYSSDMFLTDVQLADLRQRTLSLGRHFMQCREHAREEGKLYFQVRPKVHYCMHFPHQALLINPRFVQCYGEESLIGRITKIWRGSASGPYWKRVNLTVLTKYLIVVAVMYEL